MPWHFFFATSLRWWRGNGIFFLFFLPIFFYCFIIKKHSDIRRCLSSTEVEGLYMRILVIDAQGGGIGRATVSSLKVAFPDAEIVAVGTNTIATSAMLKAGADSAATGENAVVVCSRNANFIVGPIGIVIADSMLGEITPVMATAVGQSDATRILIPIHHCKNAVVGVGAYQIDDLIKSAVEEIKSRISECKK